MVPVNLEEELIETAVPKLDIADVQRDVQKQENRRIARQETNQEVKVEQKEGFTDERGKEYSHGWFKRPNVVMVSFEQPGSEIFVSCGWSRLLCNVEFLTLVRGSLAPSNQVTYI